MLLIVEIFFISRKDGWILRCSNFASKNFGFEEKDPKTIHTIS
jgi:hypothetical protein